MTDDLLKPLSIRMSYLLRHPSYPGHTFYRSGFVPLQELVEARQMDAWTERDIRSTVQTSMSAGRLAIPRFEIIQVNNIEYIRAKYGHSISLENLPPIPGEPVPVKTLSDMCVNVVCNNLPLYDLEGFPDNHVLQQIISGLRARGKFVGSALKVLLVRGLESIDFSNVYVTEGNMKQLAKSCPNLAHLSLAGCSYLATPNLIEFLAPRLVNLTTLDFSDCTYLTDACVRLLTRNIPGLETFVLAGVKHLTVASLEHLADYIAGRAGNNKRKSKPTSVASDEAFGDIPKVLPPSGSRLQLVDVRRCPAITSKLAIEFNKLFQALAAPLRHDSSLEIHLKHEILEPQIQFRDQTDPIVGPLSGFYPAPILLDGKMWPSVIHFFQAQKYHNTPVEETVRAAATAEQAQRLGRATYAAHPLRTDWEEIKVSIMRRGLEAKVAQNLAVREVLLMTGKSTLVHVSISDRIWAVPAGRIPRGGWKRDCPSGGKNILGCLLMDIRDEILGMDVPLRADVTDAAGQDDIDREMDASDEEDLEYDDEDGDDDDDDEIQDEADEDSDDVEADEDGDEDDDDGDGNDDADEDETGDIS
ncbi:hypothetical protein CAOG_08465 [Capsaspora owczarzaki ATCC 30864]|uniref:NADAR domain-containing protein n=1 Tax=Capsaspora owczarzaki (strain ATCC 30864) TaxID=595528 RepID=A0A0D2U392_CAPO3|nr:hypothetical protein CAOG_08465 [Capsaspora owczarzaki ATCC 30864]KJE89631.1 hypothetical protein CAOG_008465 [Capsaspora owczarzaki ATCC 30864]|eukprot:XP_011270037.1 hypothetical protein CAOG_08465 [Capsaspora owczarzaki ATCC 30864]